MGFRRIAPGLPARRLSRGQFRSRLTPDELRAIYRASFTDDAVADVWILTTLSERIDLDSPATAAGLDLLEARGLLKPGRLTRIRA